MKKKLKLLKNFLGHTAGTIIEVDEAEVKGLVDGGYAEEHKEAPANEGGTTTEGEKAIDELMSSFETKLDTLMKTSFSRYTKQLAKGAAARVGSKMGAALARNDAGDEEDWGYKSLGDFAMDVRVSSHPTNKTAPERLKGYTDQMRSKAPTGMNEGVYEDGGALVPTQLGQGIYERLFDQQSLLSSCDVYNLTSNAIEFAGLVDDNRATGSRFGGVRGYWLGEAQQMTPSRPKFTNVKLKLNKLAVMVYATDELIQDSVIALDQFLSKKAGQELDFQTSDSIINGAGGYQPLGILNSPGRVSVSRATANKIQFADISAMWGRMWSPARAKAAWYVNQEVESQLDTLTFNVKNVAGTENVGGWPLYIPPGGLNSSPYGMLKGRPVIPLEYCPALGTEGDIILADMSQYCVATKQGIQSAMSIHLRFDYNETAWRFIYRVDGQPWWNKPVTPYKGTSGNKYSPFVTLV